MKKIIVLIIAIFTISIANAQWTNKTMVFGGLTRSYRVYQSSNYNASVPASLLIALHGLGDNMTNFSTIGFNYIADTANIICVFPQAVTDALAGTAWNSGAGQMGYYPNSSVDDIGFINALIDTSVANYAINTSRVYLCGFSMGGFMTEKMALQSNSKIAAFGSMSGTVGTAITTFNPGRHVPIAHFHGTADSTVYYTGNIYGIDADSLIHFWITNNACNTTPTTFSYPNTVNDNITVDRFEYSNGDPQSDVWFYKMYGAGHTVLEQPTNDITEIVELWLFFIRHTFASDGTIELTTINNNVKVYPIPAKENLTIETNTNKEQRLVITNLIGQCVYSNNILNKAVVNVSAFANGVYILKLNSDKEPLVKKFVKQ